MADNTSILLIGGIVAAALYFLNNTNSANVPDLPNIPSGGVVTTPAANTSKVAAAKTRSSSGGSASRMAQYVPLGKIEQTYWAEKKGVSYANTWTDNYNKLNQVIETKRLKLGI